LARILVLDGHSPAALAFTRSLGRAGHWVAVGAQTNIHAPALVSRYCRLAFRYPVSTDDAAGFIDFLLDFLRQQSVELVVPMTDWTISPLSQYRDRFCEVSKLALGPHAALETSSDKFQTISIARELGVPIPKTVLIRSATDLETIETANFPVVVKDRFSARWQGNRARFGSVSYAYSEDDLLKQVEERLAAAGDVLVQEFVPGTGVGFSSFAVGGELYAPFEWVRVREVDPRGSGSSARKSVSLSPEILEFSCSLIGRVGFQGICMVEFKRHHTMGRPVLMEINGRPWGSLQLPIESGIDYPRFLVDWYLEGKLPPVEIAYKTPILLRRMVGELSHLENILKGTPKGWPIPYPGIVATLARISVPWYPGMRYDDLWFSDPRPGLSGLSHWLRSRLRESKLPV